MVLTNVTLTSATWLMLGISRFTDCEENMKTLNPVPKKAYEKPVLREQGSIEQITKGGRAGLSLDANFPSGTPFGDLTFS